MKIKTTYRLKTMSKAPSKKMPRPVQNVTFSSQYDMVSRYTNSVKEMSRRRIALLYSLVKESTDETLKLAKQLSDTKYYSLAELRKMGHPYSRLSPRPPIQPYVINKQSGSFYEGWYRIDGKKLVSKKDGSTYFRIGNTSPHSGFILLSEYGTKQMHRPIFNILEKVYSKTLEKKVRRY